MRGGRKRAAFLFPAGAEKKNLCIPSISFRIDSYDKIEMFNVILKREKKRGVYPSTKRGNSCCLAGCKRGFGKRREKKKNMF